MVIVRLTGGLGNQLFQYAAGFRLAQATHASLKLDTLSYRQDPQRRYELGNFCTSAQIAEGREIGLFQGRQRIRAIKCSLYQRVPSRFQKWKWIRQPSLRFCPEILNLEGNVYLDGAWQSEKYFTDVAELVRHEFTLKDKANGVNQTMADQILSTNAVCIHIRRGDYIHNPRTRAIHEVCSLNYYERALRLLTEVEPTLHVYVFSDDPGWARDNLSFSHSVTVVDHNPPDQAHEDLRLMSLCRHHIIANSSFSWWGAWLCTHSGKRVFAPNRWFNAQHYNIHDIVPAEWQLVEL